MRLQALVTTMALSASFAMPAAAQDRERPRTQDNQQQNGQGERAVPRGEGRRNDQPAAARAQRPERAQQQPQRQEPAQPQVQPQQPTQRQQPAQRQQLAERQQQAQPRPNDER